MRSKTVELVITHGIAPPATVRILQAYAVRSPTLVCCFLRSPLVGDEADGGDRQSSLAEVYVTTPGVRVFRGQSGAFVGGAGAKKGYWCQLKFVAPSPCWRDGKTLTQY